MADLKTCFICKEQKPRAEFYRTCSYCKPCRKDFDKGRTRHSPGRDTNAGEKASARKKRWRVKGLYPEHDVARRKARNAIKAGILVRPSECSDCGKPALRKDGVSAIQAHHPDHTKALEVVWLCPKCHAKADAAIASQAKEGA